MHKLKTGIDCENHVAAAFSDLLFKTMAASTSNTASLR